MSELDARCTGECGATPKHPTGTVRPWTALSHFTRHITFRVHTESIRYKRYAALA